MADLQVTYLRDVLGVAQVTNIPNAVPRMLDIRGPNFRAAIKVLINEIQTPSFVVVSKKQILAQVPDEMEKEPIKSVSVLSSKFTATNRSFVEFELTDNPQSVSGLQKLVQFFLLFLLRTPGTDAWVPNSGGGIQKLVGSYFSKNNVGSVTAAFTTSVSRVRGQIMSLQASRTNIDSTEKLASANVLSAVFNLNQTALLARVELINQAGDRAIAGLEL